MRLAYTSSTYRQFGINDLLKLRINLASEVKVWHHGVVLVNSIIAVCVCFNFTWLLIKLFSLKCKRGHAQMSVAATNKTKRIAQLQILVEQVIRCLKSFRIIKYTAPISVVPALDKINKCVMCTL